MNTPEETSPSGTGPQPLPCVLSCSGCSHAGELADHTARRLNEAGVARMSCLAGVGGRVKSIMKIVQGAPEILMIDGCPLECGANILRLAGISGFHHLKLNELGVQKHESEVCEATVQKLAASAEQLLREAKASAVEPEVAHP
ncbi:MAG TPA: putative zinc-binding protein [Candidatus Paceibacterota bacterium]|nr:putative zinc-binding protein [Candidatus Paceibacterota bacterium]